jgi:glycosyltransferase involved in cell wall biosynthesis
MRIALVHDWLNGMRGGEKVLEALCELYPEAEIFTLLLEADKISDRIRGMTIHTSFIQRLPFARRHYRHYLPLFPRAVESLDLSGFDLVISTSHAVAKGCRPPANAHSICYCFTPMRYLWFFYQDYFGTGRLKKLLLKPIFTYLRRWDVASSQRVGRFLAISKTVAGRIGRVYNREAGVIYPPVDTDFFTPGSSPPGDYFLIVSALVPYKKIALAIGAFNQLGLPLKVAGTGPDSSRLREQAGKGVEFLGWVDDEKLRELYRNCRALIFPGLEDFGIVPLEAQACGRPVIGFGEGGLAETTVPWPGSEQDPPTGVFFSEPNSDSLLAALRLFLDREGEFDPRAIRKHARVFDREIFKKRFGAAVAETVGHSRLGQ